MYEKVIYSKEELEKLYNILNELNIFLIGEKNNKSCESLEQDTCFSDTVERNNIIINQCLEKVNSISDALIGKRG